MAEAAYDLQPGPDEWLPRVLEAGGRALDRGLGCAAALWAGVSPEGEPLIQQIYVHGGPEDLAVRFTRAAREVDETVPKRAQEAHGGVSLVSKHRQETPSIYEAMTRHVGCKDVLGIWALDPDLHGVAINVPSPVLLRLRFKEREHWQMLATHIAAGHRLRRALGRTSAMPGTPVSALPLEAEALVDPKRFSVTDAADAARDPSSLDAIRNAAIRSDLARGALRRTDPTRALELWSGLVEGRWSLIDWFDTDGRRFVLAKPNAPHLGDPRGLTEREHQVATYAALGEAHKMIAYRLGISSSRVCSVLRSAMRKLGVKTQAELVVTMRGLSMLPPGDARQG